MSEEGYPLEENPLERLLRVATNGPAVEQRRGRKHKHPAGWTPGLNTERGVIVTEPLAEAPEDWSSLLVELLPPGMDPDQFSVDGDTVEVRAWDSGDGEGGTKRLYYFKARIRRTSQLSDVVDLEDIIAAVKEAVVPAAPKLEDERAYWIQITDLQGGQGDGDGVAGMVKRARQLGDLAVHDLMDLEAMGKPASQIFVPMTGDLVEGIVGWYDMQTFSVELDRRDQVKLVRRLLTEFLVTLAETGLPVHVAAVPGNHGENRQNGKAFTSLGDNDDVAVVEQIAEAFELAGLENVTFSLPAKERLSLTVEVLGHIVGLTHGHIARGGVGVEGKILNWFKSMAATRDPIGDSDILFTGHYHHARYQQLVGDTYWIQGGALCDSSAWFSQSAGLVSDPVVMKGTITRSQGIEMTMPHSWPRTKPTSKELVA
jgi:predicted phosphodiesterase